MFITNAGIADVFVIVGRTSSEGHGGITTFIVDAGNPGLLLGQPLRKMGWHASDTRRSSWRTVWFHTRRSSVPSAAGSTRSCQRFSLSGWRLPPWVSDMRRMSGGGDELCP